MSECGFLLKFSCEIHSAVSKACFSKQLAAASPVFEHSFRINGHPEWKKSFLSSNCSCVNVKVGVNGSTLHKTFSPLINKRDRQPFGAYETVPIPSIRVIR